jgi:glycerophosphoryl diester phosphodiesterase
MLLALAPQARAFDIQGHRGARGLAPENTIAGFSQALAMGVTTLETDLAVTKDGVLVIAHDPVVNPDLARGPDGQWLASAGPPIHTLTFAELRSYDIGRINPQSRYARSFPEQVAVDGERYPALIELFALAKASGKPVRFNLETKIRPARPDETVDPATFARLVVTAVRDAKLSDRVTIQSFDWRTLREVKRLAPTIATVCLTSESEGLDTVQRSGKGASPWHDGLALAEHGNSIPRLVKAAGCATWSPNYRAVTPEQVAVAHKLKLTVVPWTVNDRDEMARLIDARVDGIISDYPDRLREVAAAKGLPLP